jgi:serine/threonine-protein kinase
LESGNIATIRQAYPGLTAQQEKGWRDFFQVAQNLRVSLGVTDVQQTIDAADATVAGTYDYRDKQSRRDQHQSVSFHVSLERGGGGWRITAIR